LRGEGAEPRSARRTEYPFDAAGILIAPHPAFAARRPPSPRFAGRGKEQVAMFKLITILAAAIPVILFLKTVFFGKSKVMREASSAFRKQVDYLVWGILVLIGSALAYSVGSLIYSLWK
jgi:hypothetical protein